MALDVYLPKKLESQITAFNTNAGNYNVDYRTTETGGINVLGAAYSRVSAGSTTRLNCLPMEASGNHVSGLNSLFNEFPVDIVIQNRASTQQHIVFMTNPYPILSVNYSHTEVRLESSTKYILEHYFSFTNSFVKASDYINKTLQPVFISNSITKSSVGLVNKRDCLLIRLQPDDYNYTYSISSTLFKMSVETNEDFNNITELPVSRVDPKVLGIKSILVKDKVPEAITKNRIIAYTNRSGSVSGSAVLNNRLTNYNLYFEDLGLSQPTADIIVLPLKGDESVLINSTIKATTQGILGELTPNYWSFNTTYVAGFGSHFACIKFELPSSIPSINMVPLKMKISIDNGSSWTEMDSYISSNPIAFETDLVSFFKSYGIQCYPCDNMTFILINTGYATPYTNFVFQYSSDLSIETVTDLTMIRTKNGSTFQFTPENFPSNYSPCCVKLYGDDSDFEEESITSEFSVEVPCKSDGESYSTLVPDSISLTVHTDVALTTTTYKFEKEDGTVVEESIDLSSATEETLKDLLVTEFTGKITNFNFSVDGNKIKVTRKVVNDRFSLFKFRFTGLTIPPNSLYHTESSMDCLLLRGSV